MTIFYYFFETVGNLMTCIQATLNECRYIKLLGKSRGYYPFYPSGILNSEPRNAQCNIDNDVNAVGGHLHYKYIY